jgi:hypothetical protein
MTTPTTRKVLNYPGLREAADRAAIAEVVQTMADGGRCPHYAPNGALVSTADASDLATSKALAWALALAVPAHGADTGIHAAADVIPLAAAWTAYPLVPADLTEVQNIANELFTDINAHVAVVAAHRALHGAFSATTGAIAVHAITTTAATNQGTANALLNAIKAFLNMHTKAGISTVEVLSS